MKKLRKYYWIVLALVLFLGCKQDSKQALVSQVENFESIRIQHLVNEFWDLPPVTLTDTFCIRSAGGLHDFYSEGDYWWPDRENPDGPYVRNDGLSNPNNFVSHRHAMIRMSRIVGAMTSQYLLSGEQKYSEKAMERLRAWFVSDSTKMNPNLLFAQAIQGRYTGRGIGIIDGLHLIEVARSAYLIQNAPGISSTDINEVKNWFAEYLNWMMTHEYGKTEMVHPNNHGTCWAMQAAAFAQLTGNDSVLAFCATRMKETLIPNQMAVDGSFPLEQERTKPYGYSLFNLDAMSLLAQILYTSGYRDIWEYENTDGKSLKLAGNYMFPFIRDKASWKLKPDVLYWEDWPVSQAALVLQGLAYQRKDFIELWEKLEHDSEVEEVQRNLVMRYPLLWLDYE
ncbi:MAG: alginate lyase family protein [Prolixibacteraceae bacterium]